MAFTSAKLKDEHLFPQVMGVESKSTSAPVALYTVVGVEVLPEHGAPPPSEGLATVLVDSLLRVALRSNCNDLKAGGYMILSKLSTTASLNAPTIDSLISVLVKVLHSLKLVK